MVPCAGGYTEEHVYKGHANIYRCVTYPRTSVAAEVDTPLYSV